MSSLTQLSICVPETGRASQLKDFCDNVNQFFLKFPLQYEVLFAMEPKQHPKQDQSREQLAALKQQYPFIRTVELVGKNSRAMRQQKLFESAKGTIVTTLNVELSIPLGDVFKMLQELFTDQDLQVVFGNRFAKTKTEPQKLPRPSIESFFQGVVLEKTKWPFKDMFCSTFAIRKSAFESILPLLRSTGWNWTHEVQRVTLQKELKAVEVPVMERAVPLNKGHRWLESLKLLSFTLFRA